MDEKNLGYIYWLVRDGNGKLKLFLPVAKPAKESDGHWRVNNPLSNSSGFVILLPADMFPNVVWEDSEATAFDIRKLGMVF